MDFAIVASKKDKAGMNIVEELKKLSNLPIYLTEKEIIYAENIDEEIEKEKTKTDFVIFASKHASQQQRKTLSCHAPGNWEKAEFGGKERQVCRTSAFFLKHLFQTLNEQAKNSEYEVTLEVTHHGPYIEKPCCFIEIGSSEKEWQDKKAGKIIAETIKKSIETFNREKLGKWKAAIGIGSRHYCPNFNKIQLNSDIAIGHIIPQYAFPITEEMLKEAVNKTEEQIPFALIDWKGLRSKERQETIRLLNQLNIKYKRTSDVKKK